MEENYSYEYEFNEGGIGEFTEGFEIPEENYTEELEYSDDFKSIDAIDEPIDFTDKINRIETLRTQRDKEFDRKNNLMITLAELFEEGLVSFRQ
jgi:hypothetical protein